MGEYLSDIYFFSFWEMQVEMFRDEIYRETTEIATGETKYSGKLSVIGSSSVFKGL